ncbi:MAG: CoA pyrophosphatase [Lysobacterales bacterium]
MDQTVDVPVLSPDNPLSAVLSKPLVPAAVLVPLVFRDQWQVIFTHRTEKLSNHGGQISFPGGRRESADRSFVDTALRESQEEIGLDPQQVSLMGFLDSVPVITGFGVVPVVGLVAGEPRLKMDPREVQAVFEVPLAFLLDQQNYRQETLQRAGRTARFHVIEYESWRIWGATAAMAANFAQRMTGVMK